MQFHDLQDLVILVQLGQLLWFLLALCDVQQSTKPIGAECGASNWFTPTGLRSDEIQVT